MTDTNDTTPVRPATPAPDADATDVLFGDSGRTEPAASWPGPAGPLPQPERLRPRFGTILWGVIVLVFAGFMVTNAIVPFVVDPSAWIIAGLVAGGVVLVVAGIAAAVRRAD
ncbi:hypothetical protein [Mycetocola sp. 2940]|uniref:hypothetical protein n=1 Tax=Mycetocola sp. 2940 TaxID=3156452 RepID=UPI003391EC40